jgi:alanyl-tRNA synthetase
MTERLYYHDATLRTFVARVIDVADGGRRVYLDRTAFYPTSGGQPHDVGQLDGVRVVDVVDEEGRIAHVIDAPMAAGAPAEVRGEIDWERRYDHMQQHTGQHLLSAVLEDLLGLRTVSVHFGSETSTLDVADAAGDASVLEADLLARVELRANQVVAEARPVTVTVEDASVATGLRKPSDRAGALRIVSIDGLDRSACGGTHVANTAEIGPLLLRRQERVRQGLRIEFICGQRAISRTRRDLDLLTRIARPYSASIDETARLVENQVAEVSALRSENRRLAEAQAKYRATELYAASPVRADGLRVIVERIQGGVDSAKSLAMAFAPFARVLFIGASKAPPSVLVATSADSGIDAGKTLRPVLESIGGRGGGSARLAQGSVPSAESIEGVVSALKTAGVNG